MGRRRAHALRAAARMVAVIAAHQRDDEAEHRRLDEAGDDVLGAQIVDGLAEIAAGVEAELVGADQKPAEHADDVGDQHQHRQRVDAGDQPRHDEVFERVGRERRQGVDLVGDAHGADLGGDRRRRSGRPPSAPAMTGPNSRVIDSSTTVATAPCAAKREKPV